VCRRPASTGVRRWRRGERRLKSIDERRKREDSRRCEEMSNLAVLRFEKGL